MDNKENEKQAKLKEFQRRFPHYMNGKKVIFPIMDEIIVSFSSIFPQFNQFGKLREGHLVKSFSAVPLNQLIELTTFLNSYPYSPQFAAVSDSQNQFQSLLSPLLKLTGHLVRDYHTNKTLSMSYGYSTFETQEQADKMNFKLIAFIVEDIFKYKMGLLKPIDIVKQKQAKDEIKKKSNKSQKISLVSLIEKQTQQEEENNLNQDLTKQSEKYEFESYLDPTCSNFWKVVYESFTKIIKKSQKRNQQEMETENDSDEQESMAPKGVVNQENIEMRRQIIQAKLQQLSKLKDQNKKKNKQSKQLSQMKSFKIKEKFTELENQRFNNLFKFMITNWPSLLLQAIKLPYVQSLFNENELKTIKSIGTSDLGYFSLKIRERADIASALIEGVRETDSFKVIVDYRQELTDAISLILENVQDELTTINTSILKKDGQYSIAQQQQYRKVYKQYLQLVEFNRLFINGCLFLGSDIHGYDYYFFPNDVDKIFQNKGLGSEWRFLEVSQVQQLFTSLNIHGVKERELQTNIQKLIACELYNDPETKELLTQKEIIQQPSGQCFKSPKQMIVKILLEVVSRFTDILMVKRMRWESFKVREKFQNTIRTLENLFDMVNFMKILVEQFEVSYNLVLDQQKMANESQYDQKDLIEFQNRIRFYEQKISDISDPQMILFYDPQLFQMMEAKEFIKPNGLKTNTKFWQLSLGLEVKEALLAFANKIDKEHQQYDVLFMASVLLLAVQEFEISNPQQDSDEDEKLKQLVKEAKNQIHQNSDNSCIILD